MTCTTTDDWAWGCAKVALILCPAKLSVKDISKKVSTPAGTVAERQIEWMMTRGFAAANGPGEGVQGLVAALADGGREAACANTYAALDLGTNNCRLLIACPTGDSFRVVDLFSRIIRLGEGVSTSGVISDAAIARAISALSICRDKIRARDAHAAAG